MKKLLIIFLIILFTPGFTYSSGNNDSTETQPTTKRLIEELQSDIDALLDNRDFSDSFIGISIQSLETGEYFYRLNDNKNFNPASMEKLITSSAALDYLGNSFTYSTKLYLDGKILPNGEYRGNIYIRGSGDPSISKTFDIDPLKVLGKWAKELDSMGISKIKGNIIGDDRYFDKMYYAPGWNWDDLVYPYAAQVSALSINDNKIDISIFQGDTIGDPAKVQIYPQTSYVRIINNIKTVQGNQPTFVNSRRELKTNFIELEGLISFDSTKKNKYDLSVTIDNPTLYFLSLFKDVLEKNRIRVEGSIFDINDWMEKVKYPSLQLATEWESPQIKNILKVVNKQSLNLGSEMILKTLAKETTGEGSFQNGTDQVQKFLNKAGISTDNIRIADGSGLSRQNLNSPKNFISLLSYIYRSKMKDDILNTLAEPGETGTLQRRMKMTRAEKHVIAKTGSMNYVNNICGYVTTRDGEPLAFVIMVQNFTVPPTLATNLQDLILMRLASFSRKRE